MRIRIVAEVVTEGFESVEEAIASTNALATESVVLGVNISGAVISAEEVTAEDDTIIHEK
jgi:hypothetical protein